MDENILLMQQILESKGIKDYTILQEKNLGFTFKDVFKCSSIEHKDLSTIKALLEFNGKKGIFFSSCIEYLDKFEAFVNNCLENPFSMEILQAENEFALPKDLQNDSKIVYENFDAEKYKDWIINEINLISKKAEFDMNFIYYLKASKFKIFKNTGFEEGYITESQFICIENKNFQQNAILNDIFINYKLADDILKMLNI